MLKHPQHGCECREITAQPDSSTLRPRRPIYWIITNTLLAGLLILLAPDPTTTLVVGGFAIGLAAITGANIARGRMAGMRSMTPLDVLAAWLPGLSALGLAIAGLALVVLNPAQELLRLGGIALFLIQILFIAALGATAERVGQPVSRSPASHSA
jgi:hypothetical protein